MTDEHRPQLAAVKASICQPIEACRRSHWTRWACWAQRMPAQQWVDPFTGSRGFTVWHTFSDCSNARLECGEFTAAGQAYCWAGSDTAACCCNSHTFAAQAHNELLSCRLTPGMMQTWQPCLGHSRLRNLEPGSLSKPASFSPGVTQDIKHWPCPPQGLPSPHGHPQMQQNCRRCTPLP